MNSPFTFLVCSERSGSNFITKILDGHSQYCGPSPVHLLRVFVPLESSYGNTADDANWNSLVNDVHTFYNLKISSWDATITPQELLQVKERSLAGLFRMIYLKEAGLHGKSRLFVKENHSYRLLPYYEMNFPGSRYIWAVRDPRDMALSWKKDAILRGGIVRSSGIWKEDQKHTIYLNSYLAPAGKMLQVKYENLTAQTEEEAARICTFLGVPFESEMVKMKSSSSGKNAEASPSWSNLNKGVIKNNSRKFLDGLSREEIEFIEYLCKEEMAALGYEPVYPIVDRAKFNNLQYELSNAEQWDKEAYLSVSETEKVKRRQWGQWVNELQKRSR